MDIELKNKLRLCGVEVSDEGIWLSPVDENNYALFHKLSDKKQILGIGGEAYAKSNYCYFCTVPIEFCGIEVKHITKLHAREDANHYYKMNFSAPYPEKAVRMTLFLTGFPNHLERLTLDLTTEEPMRLRLRLEATKRIQIKEIRIQTGKSSFEELKVALFKHALFSLDKLKIKAENIVNLQLFPRKEIDFEFIGKEPSQLKIDHEKHSKFSSFVVNGEAVDTDFLERVTEGY